MKNGIFFRASEGVYSRPREEDEMGNIWRKKTNRASSKVLVEVEQAKKRMMEDERDGKDHTSIYSRDVCV